MEDGFTFIDEEKKEEEMQEVIPVSRKKLKREEIDRFLAIQEFDITMEEENEFDIPLLATNLLQKN